MQLHTWSRLWQGTGAQKMPTLLSDWLEGVRRQDRQAILCSFRQKREETRADRTPTAPAGDTRDEQCQG